MLADPQVAGWFGLWALWQWIKKEPWFAIPLFLSLFLIALCESKSSLLYHMYQPATISQIRDICLAVGSVDLVIIMCRRNLIAWLVFGIPTNCILWLQYGVDGKEHGLLLVMFYTGVFALGVVASLVLSAEKHRAVE